MNKYLIGSGFTFGLLSCLISLPGSDFTFTPSSFLILSLESPASFLILSLESPASFLILSFEELLLLLLCFDELLLCFEELLLLCFEELLLLCFEEPLLLCLELLLLLCLEDDDCFDGSFSLSDGSRGFWDGSFGLLDEEELLLWDDDDTFEPSPLLLTLCFISELDFTFGVPCEPSFGFDELELCLELEWDPSLGFDDDDEEPSFGFDDEWEPSFGFDDECEPSFGFDDECEPSFGFEEMCGFEEEEECFDDEWEPSLGFDEEEEWELGFEEEECDPSLGLGFGLDELLITLCLDEEDEEEEPSLGLWPSLYFLIALGSFGLELEPLDFDTELEWWLFELLWDGFFTRLPEWFLWGVLFEPLWFISGLGFLTTAEKRGK